MTRRGFIFFAAGFSLGNAFAHWALRRFDVPGQVALGFGVLLCVLLAAMAIAERGSK